jgi:chitinase
MVCMKDSLLRLLFAAAAASALGACSGQGALPTAAGTALTAPQTSGTVQTDHSCRWDEEHAIANPSCGTATSAPATAATPTPNASGSGCAPSWNASTVYTGGAHVSYNGVGYTAAYWTQGNTPSTSNGPAGSGQPWISNGPCNGATAPPTAAPTVQPTRAPSTSPTTAPAAPPTGAPTQGPPPAGGFIFSPYKDTGTNMNWNTNVISTAVTGALQPLTAVMPAHDTTVTLAFATGTCGSENWAGIPAASFISANIGAFASSSKYYVISTGGASGVFTCASTSAFISFVKSYYSSHMLGVDFDIEGGQSQSDINNLVQDVKAAQASYPNVRYSFTLATLSGSSSAGTALGTLGVEVLNAIKSVGLTRYTINLMTMDYGSASSSICVDISGVCEMGQSADQAAVDLHTQFGVPYSQIELTPMIGGNDNQAETFTLADAATISTFARQNGLAGVHFWSFDRDVDCAPGSASSTCNSYGKAGTLGFTNAFISDLGL